MLSSIPSPGFNTVGPFTLYGLMIALGVIAAYELARRRWESYGGDPDDVGTVAVWAVPAGLIGARLYHVATDWNRLYADSPMDAFRIQEGGLGIPGGVLLGVALGAMAARSKGMRLSMGLDMAAPALPLAQAIGRLGNWWNQELYGGPTDLPWGLEIDPEHRQAGYFEHETFHPTFLYEALWNLALMGLIVWLGRKRVLRPGRLFAVYVGGYGLGRLWIEAVRIDTASRVAGVRVNIWMSGLLIVGALAVLLIGGLRRRPDDDFEPYDPGRGPAAAGDGESTVSRRVTPKLAKNTPKPEKKVPKSERKTPKLERKTPKLEKNTPKPEKKVPKLEKKTPKLEKKKPG